MTDTTIVFLWLSGMLCGYSIGFLVARASIAVRHGRADDRVSAPSRGADRGAAVDPDLLHIVAVSYLVLHRATGGRW